MRNKSSLFWSFRVVYEYRQSAKMLPQKKLIKVENFTQTIRNQVNRKNEFEKVLTGEKIIELYKQNTDLNTAGKLFPGKYL